MKFALLAGLLSVAAYAVWLFSRSDYNDPDETHRRASKAWRGVDWEGLS